MKKLISVLLCFVFLFPFVAKTTVTIAENSEKRQAKKISQVFSELVREYDNGDYISDIVLDETDGVRIKGDDFSIPWDVLLENCAEDVKAPKKSKTVNKAYAEKLGFEVEINEDEVTLSQPYQTHRLIVKGENIDKLDSLEIIPYFDGLYIVQFDDLESTLAALEYYKKQDNIEFANPDAIVSSADYDSGDVSFAALEGSTSSTSWGSAAIGFNTAFKLRMGLASFLPTIKVGVIDTGVSLSHNQIKSRLIETNFNCSNSGRYNHESDDNGHGTHVAGIIAQNTLSNVKICGYKVLDKYGMGTVAMVMNGLIEAYYDGVSVINLSLSGWNGTPVYDVQHQMYDFLEMHSITCCVAAGNEGKDCFNLAPAQYDECITVAAMNENDEIPEWSNYGKCVDIIAPGVDISSAYYFGDDTYFEMSGTSMATPFVAAAAADILSKNPNASPQEIKEFLQINGRDINAPEHFYGAPALYLGNIRNFNMYEKPKTPTFSLSEGVYSENAKLKISKTSGTDIYYQIYDYNTSNKVYPLTERTKYKGEITLDKPCIIVAVASYNTFLDSDTTQGRYYIQYSSDENKFTIDESGRITGYSGNTANLVIPEEVNGIPVTAIGENVFTQYDKYRWVNSDPTTNYLRSVTLPDTCTTVERNAFFGCMYMTDVYAGNLQYIGIEAFTSCCALENIDFSTTKSIETGAFSNSGVIAVVSDSIETIGFSAFGGCNELSNIEINSINEISDNAFEYCGNLTSVTLGNSLSSVGSGAFKNCLSLTDVYFNGTIDEWESIEIGEDNECLKNATIHCLTPEYEIQSFDGITVTLIDKDGKTISVNFANYMNKSYEPLDVVEDGVINAKDYAYLLKNYSR